MNNDIKQLLPCCGGKVSVQSEAGWRGEMMFYVWCEECELKLGWERDPAIAIKLWNTRNALAKQQDHIVEPNKMVGDGWRDKHERGEILLSAFRYCLGRRTYVTSDCVEWLTKYWDDVYWWHEQIHRDIKRAIEQNIAGDDCDIAVWKNILELPIATKTDKE